LIDNLSFARFFVVGEVLVPPENDKSDVLYLIGERGDLIKPSPMMDGSPRKRVLPSAGRLWRRFLLSPIKYANSTLKGGRHKSLPYGYV